MGQTICFVEESRNYKYICKQGVKKVHFGMMNKMDRRCEVCLRADKHLMEKEANE